jgi:hypothetical protein
MNVAGDGGGRTGPYWRRQLGTTLPGERTGQELNLINNLRRKAGLPPLGGAVGENTRFASPAPDRGRTDLLNDPGGRPAIAGPPLQRPGPPPLRHPMPVTPGGDVMIPEQPGGFQGGFEGQLPNPQAGGDIRQILLARLQGQAPPVSRDALLRYVQQGGLRQAQPGPARPILPPRQPLRKAALARPY